MFKAFKYLKPVVGYIVLAILTVVGQALLDLQIPAQFVDLSLALSQASMEAVWMVVLKMFAFVVGAVLLAVIAAYFTSLIGARYGEILRGEMYRKVQSMSVKEIESFGIASLITRTTNDINQLQMIVSMGLRIVVLAPVMLIGGLLKAFAIQKEFSIVFAVAIPLIALTILFIGISSSRLFVSVQKKIDNLTAIAREGLTGVRVIRAFNQQEYEKEKYTQANTEVRDVSIQVNRVMARLFPLSSLFMNLTIIGILIVATVIFNGQVDPSQEVLIKNVGATSTIVGYSSQILGSIIGMSFIFMMIPRAQASANRILEVVNAPLSVTDPEHPLSLDNVTEKGKLEFKNVTFSFANAEQPVLNNISFTMLPGQTTAVIGSTGSGKSSLVNLIPRFYDPQQGEILLDGVNIRDITQKDLRSRMGFVPQNAVLFSGTVRENLLYGNPNATDEDLKLATDIAQATEFVENTPDGMNHFIAQGGKNLSGGQKQRLAIARALVRRPEIYVFDDSFSALDFKTDANLRKALKKQIQADGSSVLIVAQRVSTVLNADQIVVLDNGNMVGIGKHGELMKTCEPYREIVLSQINEEEANG